MRLTLATLAFLTLSACFPAGQVIETGPWTGCIASDDGTTVACEWDVPTPERTKRVGEPAAAPQPDPDIGPLNPPGGPRPIPAPGCEPLCPTDPPPTTDEEPVSAPCKPGWGWGSSHCHDGPPGREEP